MLPPSFFVSDNDSEITVTDDDLSDDELSVDGLSDDGLSVDGLSDDDLSYDGTFKELIIKPLEISNYIEFTFEYFISPEIFELDFINDVL